MSHDYVSFQPWHPQGDGSLLFSFLKTRPIKKNCHHESKMSYLLNVILRSYLHTLNGGVWGWTLPAEA